VIVVHGCGRIVHGKGIHVIEIGPQGSAVKIIAINHYRFFVQQGDVGNVMDVTKGPEAFSTLGKVTRVVFVIAHHIQSPGPSLTHPQEKVSSSVTTLALLVQIFEHTDITSQNQEISTLCVHKINVSKLHM
jgi:hypothetical protein